MADMAAGDPAAEFAALMAGAAEQADAEADPAPYGYTRDRQTGEMRPKRSPGRGGARSPSVDELKASSPVAPEGSGEEDGGGSDGAPLERQDPPPADRAPDEKRARLSTRKAKADKPDAPVPQYRAGVIAKGMNKLYARVGKIVRVGDREIGQAIIDATRKESDDDVTVGEAWEELAKTNPRIRKFLLKLIAGGAWGQLVMAHMPILLAVVMKPAVLRLIPFSRVIASLAEPDEDTPEGEGGLPGGMTVADAGQMAELARQQMAAMGLQLDPETSAKMAEMAAGMLNGAGPPARQVRHQPRRPASRADRRGS